MFLLSDPQQAHGILKGVQGLGDLDHICFTMTNVIGFPARAVDRIFREDDSGIGAKPRPGSTTPPERRARYHMTKSTHKNLSGRQGVQLGVMFKNILLRNLDRDPALNETEWKHHTDLWNFMFELIFPPATEVMFGKRILELNPSFISEIRGFLEDIPAFLALWPRWLRPGPFRRRASATEAVKKWVAEIRDHCSKNSEWNPDHGCDHIKDRHYFMASFEEWTLDVQACEGLGLFLA